MKFSRQWLKGFIFEQHCIPWSVKKRLAKYRYLVRNANTQSHWDSTWDEEIKKGKRRELSNLYREIFQRVPRGSGLLDVGCGGGELLERARSEMECDVFGVDISFIAIKHLNERGIPGIASRVPPVPVEDGAFDVVVATQLLEHVHSPKRVLRELFRAVKAGGLCIISVPDNCMAPHEEPEHNHLFDCKKLEKLVIQACPKATIELLSVQEKGASTKRLLAICKLDK